MRTYSFKALFQTKPRFVGENAGGGDIGGGGGQTTATSPATPSQPTQTAPSGGGGQQTVSAPSQVSQPAASPSFRDRLGKLGIDTSRFADDEAAFAGLGSHLEQVRAQEQFARLGQQAYPQWTEFQKWQKVQQEAAAAEAAKKNQWWNPPEWDEKWLEGVERDPATGELRPKQGFDPVLPSRIQAYRAFQQQMLHNLTKDPIATLKPGLEPLVRQLAAEIVQQHLQGYSQQTNIQQIVQQNEWLYEKEADGRFKMGPQGGKVLSLAGQIMKEQTGKIEARFKRYGITPDPVEVFQEAAELTRGTLFQMQADQARQQQTTTVQQTPAQQAAAAAAAAAGGGGTNRLQTLSDAGAGTAGVPRRARPSLGQMMNQALDKAGITSLN
jgi:hypothetical protein